MNESSYWTRAANRRLSRRQLLHTAALSGAGLAIAGSPGCSQGGGGEAKPAAPTSSQPKKGGILQSSTTTDPVHWDSHQTTSIYTHSPNLYAHETLLVFPAGPKYDAGDATPTPNLAESWEQPDDMTYIFKLRKGAKWHNKPPVNGRELEAEDVKYTFDRIQRVKAPFRGMFDKIAKIETPDKYTVKMTTSEPFAPLLNFLSHYYAQIYAREVEDQYGDFKKPETVIGLGPFMLETYEPNSKIVYKRHPEYFMSGLPYLDGVEIKISTDSAANMANFRAGQVAVASTTSSDLTSLKATNPDLTVFEAYSVVAWGVNFRTDKAPYNDRRLRQAIALCMDRKSWVESYYEGKGSPDNGPIQALWKEWKLATDQLGAGAEFYKQDMAKAKRLLSEAGYPDGFKVSFEFTNGYGLTRVEETELVKDYVSKIGVQLDIKILEYGAFINAVMNSNPTYNDMSYAGVRFMGDPDETLWDMYHPKGSKNFSKVNDPKANELIEKQRRTMNKVERKKIVDDAQRYLAEQCYYVFAPAQITLSVWHPWLKNYRPSFTYDNGTILREVWMDK